MLTSSQLDSLTDEQLDDLILQALGRLSPPMRRYVELYGAGMKAKEARDIAYGPTRKNLPMTPSALRAVALLRAKHSRKAGTTAQELRQFWVKLRDRAFAERRYDAANRANELLAKLGGLFPEVAMRLRVEGEVTTLHEVSPAEWARLAHLRHELRRELPPSIDVTPEERMSPIESPVPLEAASGAGAVMQGSRGELQSAAEEPTDAA